MLAARSSLAYLRLDAALADLVHDSAGDHDLSVVGFRSAGMATRQLAFRSGHREIEVEIIEADDRRRLIGHCIPAATVEVAARVAGDEHRTTVSDDLGRFSIEVAAGVVSLRCTWPDADHEADGVIETGWVRFWGAQLCSGRTQWPGLYHPGVPPLWIGEAPGSGIHQ